MNFRKKFDVKKYQIKDYLLSLRKKNRITYNK